MNKSPYKHIITLRVPDAVYEALMKRVKSKKTKYPSYTDSEAIRKALVKHLKDKGYLDKDKNYL